MIQAQLSIHRGFCSVCQGAIETVGALKVLVIKSDALGNAEYKLERSEADAAVCNLCWRKIGSKIVSDTAKLFRTQKIMDHRPRVNTLVELLRQREYVTAKEGGVLLYGENSSREGQFRNAVSQARAAGYRIEAVHKKGYKLIERKAS